MLRARVLVESVKSGAPGARRVSGARVTEKSVCQLLGTLDDSEDGFFSSDAVLDDSFIEAWVANLRCEPPQPDSRWLVYEWAGTCTFASLTSPPGPQNPFYAEPPRPFGGGIFGSRAVGERWTYAQREKFVLRAIKNAVACVADFHEAGVAHRGLSGAAFVLDSSGMDKNVVPKNAPLSVVRLQFLGFSDSASVANMNDDLNSLGYVLLELLLSPALYPEDYAGPSAARQRRRLFKTIVRRHLRLRHFETERLLRERGGLGRRRPITGHDGRLGVSRHGARRER